MENRGNIFKGNCYNSSSSLTFGHQMGSVRDCYGGRMQMLSLFLKKSLRGGGGKFPNGQSRSTFNFGEFYIHHLTPPYCICVFLHMLKPSQFYFPKLVPYPFGLPNTHDANLHILEKFFTSSIVYGLHHQCPYVPTPHFQVRRTLNALTTPVPQPQYRPKALP